jgi:hypothetical protein
MKGEIRMSLANTITGPESLKGTWQEKDSGDDNKSRNVNSPQLILQSALVALSGGRFSEVLTCFGNRFRYNDHAPALEFTDKPRSTEFFEKSRELFPDTTLEIVSLFEDRDHAIAEWKLAATQTVPYGSISYHPALICWAQQSCGSRTGELSNGRTTTTKTRLGASIWQRSSQTGSSSELGGQFVKLSAIPNHKRTSK